MTDLKELEASLGYKFQNGALLESALRHTSYANEHQAEGASSNERLEFLGDSILGFVTAGFLFSQNPELTEGNMSKIRAELVCEHALCTAAAGIKLGEFLFLGVGEELTGGRSRPSILSDAMEALIAAIYLDSGIDEVSAVIKKLILPAYSYSSVHARDNKTKLQEYVQKTPGAAVKYKLIRAEGPDHARIYISEAEALGRFARGEGKTKKESEQAAAGNLYRIISP